MKILITGATGHLGTTLVAAFSGRHDVIATTSAELDVRDEAAVLRAIVAAGPEAVVNCAAYTDVDRAEEEPVKALAVNAVGVRAVASAAATCGAALVHYSTDFVFDGTAARPYVETDPPNPRSTYASSKLIGEWFAADVPRHYVLRVESLFGGLPALPGGRTTSIGRILEAVAAGEAAPVFTDRTITPSYMPDVARATEELLERGVPAGLYHCVNSGSCSFMELAEAAARLLGTEARLRPVRMEDLRLRADRPRYCALSNERLAQVGIPMPSWQDALTRHLRARAARG